MNVPTDSTVTTGNAARADSVYDNSAETGIVPGAEFEQGDVDAGEEQTTSPGGLSRTSSAGSTLSDNVTGNNSMGTNTIGGGLGVGSSNSNSTLP